MSSFGPGWKGRRLIRPEIAAIYGEAAAQAPVARAGNRFGARRTAIGPGAKSGSDEMDEMDARIREFHAAETRLSEALMARAVGADVARLADDMRRAWLSGSRRWGLAWSTREHELLCSDAAANQSPSPPNTRFETPTHSDPALEQTRKVAGDSAKETRVGAAISAGDRGHRP